MRKYHFEICNTKITLAAENELIFDRDASAFQTESQNSDVEICCEVKHTLLPEGQLLGKGKLKNAYEHTKKNGTIEISCEENPIYVEIKIKDNGCGIAENDIQHIFERFYKGKNNKESIGIGLNMALKIVNLQNGDIKVESVVGEGTTFKIKFYKNVI